MLTSILLMAQFLFLPAGADDLEKVKISDVRPTQFAVGMVEVDLRQAAIRKAIEDDELSKLLKKKPGTVVIGPPGKTLYLIDGHHFARALIEEGVTEMRVEIKKDWSDLSESKFWKKMKAKKWVYLRGLDGSIQTPKDLPTTMSSLQDDPFRSLAYLVRKAGGFDNLDEPFQEFAWADFFRKKMKPFNPKDSKSLEAAVQEALELSRSADAKKLPGYVGLHAAAPCVLSQLLKSIKN